MENELIERLEDKLKMRITSSPRGQFLELAKNQSTNYLIFNALGEIEMQGALNENRRIDIHLLQRGIYFIQFLFSGQTPVTRQFMKV